ncbi:rhomboid family intramembrane serine protease [Chroococcidiopsis sp. TS-821]|uniref:rhomboid family intramembrane serine protease n=1 Tax=Chroococcidiopsis sp. TS-821 TaxID=1378066 RepID=UPI000CEF4918|nr:rhomboid family intramembrane serine protease [Chroococcidiopsis sp. TS-821]PPS45079.1 rhomboid family intramembrane serine protease [Chroococcidiopsis sp. TS-821]
MLNKDQPLTTYPKQNYNGVFTLIIVNLVVFIADRVLGIPFIQNLYLNHASPAWYQFFTSMFCHANWAHISGNLFFLYIFGRIVEEEEGIVGVVSSYIICGLGGSLMSYFFHGGAVYSLGASGAVFGLFAVSVLIKLSWHWRKILEVLILGQFVIERVVFELRQTGIQDGVDHIAHLGGALVGVVLILFLMRLQPTEGARGG